MRPETYKEQDSKCCNECLFSYTLNEDCLVCLHGELLNRGLLLRKKWATGDDWKEFIEPRYVQPTGICDEFKAM